MNLSALSQDVIAELSDRLDEIQTLAGDKTVDYRKWPFEKSADIQMSVSNFLRWLKATSSPSLQFATVNENREGFRHLLALLSVSQPLADTIIQNPEFAQLVIEQNYENLDSLQESVVNEGTRLLKSADSIQYAQDRLRFLKQKVRIGLVDRDIFGEEPCNIWQGLADEADALLSLSLQATWNRFRAEKGIEVDVPISILGFGKLGGNELNYSSDVDLVFVTNNNAPMVDEVLVSRFCQVFMSSLSIKMGRGNLYRVDLRLRPYGASGSIFVSPPALASYYRNYAENWEILALIRARWIGSPSQEQESFLDSLKEEICFRSQWSDASIEEILRVRQKIDIYSEPNDFKRGKGGIRDVEFLCQLFQLVLGAKYPQIRSGSTLTILKSLEVMNILTSEEYNCLKDNYIFLRQLEHRCQLLIDIQTHQMPESIESQKKIAFLVGFGSIEELKSRLEMCRREVSNIYDSHWQIADAQFQLDADSQNITIRRIFNRAPNGDELYAAVRENRDSEKRLNLIVERAPELIPFAESSYQLLEQIISGEIEEDNELFDLAPYSSIEQLAQAWNYALIRQFIQWALNPTSNLSEKITQLYDSLINCLFVEDSVTKLISIVALGSFGRKEMTFGSDLDILFMVEDRENQPWAESLVQTVLAKIEKIRQLGAPISVDIRLRPDGAKGLLVRTHEAVSYYGKYEADAWERFAIGQYRLLNPNPNVDSVLTELGYGMPLTLDHLKELIQMKKRIEMERVNQDLVWRDIKLGYGSLSDIEWLVHLYEMRYSNTMKGSRSKTLVDRIQNLMNCGLINAVESEELKQAHAFLMMLKHALALQGKERAILPENPNRLCHVSQFFNFEDPNQLLKRHQDTAARTREIYEEGISRLLSSSS